MNLPAADVTARILFTSMIRNVTTGTGDQTNTSAADYWSTHKIAAIRHVREILHSMGYTSDEAGLKAVKDALEETIKVEHALAVLRETCTFTVHEPTVRMAVGITAR